MMKHSFLISACLIAICSSFRLNRIQPNSREVIINYFFMQHKIFFFNNIRVYFSYAVANFDGEKALFP